MLMQPFTLLTFLIVLLRCVLFATSRSVDGIQICSFSSFAVDDVSRTRSIFFFVSLGRQKWFVGNCRHDCHHLTGIVVFTHKHTYIVNIVFTSSSCSPYHHLPETDRQTPNILDKRGTSLESERREMKSSAVCQYLLR